MAMGVIWEFLEWISDILFDLNAQPSLQDTMLDLLADTIGGVLMAFIGLYLIRKGILRNLTKDFKEYIHSNFDI
jgi:putative Mn2+ efflux pump MntP